MSEVGRPSAIASILYGLFPLLVGAGVLFVLVTIGGKAMQGYEMRQEAKAVEQQVDQLKRENRELATELEYYKSDQYIEKVAREELGLVRPGDVPVVIISPGNTRTSPDLLPKATPVPTASPRTRDTAIWQRWLAIFVDSE